MKTEVTKDASKIKKLSFNDLVHNTLYRIVDCKSPVKWNGWIVVKTMSQSVPLIILNSNNTCENYFCIDNVVNLTFERCEDGTQVIITQDS